MARYSSAERSWSFASIVEARRRPVEAALRLVDVGVGDRGAHVLEAEPVRGERLRVRLDAHRRPLAAGERDEADAGDLRDLLREARVGEVLQLAAAAASSTSSAEREDRRVGRVDLAVDRRRRQVLRAAGSTAALIAACTSCSATSSGSVEVELQRDHRRAAGARRRHLLEARHLAELALERRGDRRGHHVRARARIERERPGSSGSRPPAAPRPAACGTRRCPRAGSRPSAAWSPPAAG